MKIHLFYRPQTEADLPIETFLKTLGDSAAAIELVNVDTRDGDDLSRLYNIMSYPSLIVATADGLLVKFWHGELPPLSEIEPYLNTP